VFRAKLILMLAEGSMRRPQFKPWIVSIPSCRSRRDVPNATASSTTGTERFSLYAALNTTTGRVHGNTAARHTSREFVAFLQEVVSLCPPRQQIHIILDNLSAHKTQAVREFLQQHPRVRFHFTPTYSSWLNQVEIWFAKIEREVIARGIFTSVSDLACKLGRYINAYSANARPIQWKYSDLTRRVRSNELTATGH
jgi:transposase